MSLQSGNGATLKGERGCIVVTEVIRFKEEVEAIRPQVTVTMVVMVHAMEITVDLAVHTVVYRSDVVATLVRARMAVIMTVNINGVRRRRGLLIE